MGVYEHSEETGEDEDDIDNDAKCILEWYSNCRLENYLAIKSFFGHVDKSSWTPKSLQEFNAEIHCLTAVQDFDNFTIRILEEDINYLDLLAEIRYIFEEKLVEDDVEMVDRVNS